MPLRDWESHWTGAPEHAGLILCVKETGCAVTAIITILAIWGKGEDVRELRRSVCAELHSGRPTHWSGAVVDSLNALLGWLRRGSGGIW